MGTDRELLEAAVKAAGIDWVDGHESTGLRDQNGRVWNPLTDDGDALRLAVKLLFEIDMDRRSIAIRHQTGVKILKAFNNDPCATTRRAIVRAAAEIGRSMK
ncbi:MAG: hypothetical protein RLZZ09_3262 [Pseudomonadota bacterium]|jgi:Ser-tRNA(Ala) deacylase AlaX